MLLVIFALVACAAGEIRFVAHGDWGDNNASGQERQGYIAEIMDQWCARDDKKCDFIMTLGDNFYPDGAEAVDDDRFNYNWRDKYIGDNIKDLTWYISVGNHDHIDDNEVYQLQFGEIEERWYFPWYYYGFELEDEDTKVFFYAMDSEALRINKWDPAAQLKEMDTLLNETDADWKIVFGHHPPLSVGRRWGDDTIFDQVVPICESHGVDTLIAGHDHNLQHIQRTGNVDIDYVVSGGGGRSLYAYESDNEDTIRGLGYEPLFFAYQWGFLGVTITGSEMQMEFFTYDIQGENVNMELLYEFTRYKVVGNKEA